MEVQSLEARLHRVEALEEVRLLKARYCDLCDAGYPADELCTLFTDDAVWDGGEMGVFDGKAAIHQFFTNMPSVMSMAIHHITNSAVEISSDAQSALGRWYLLQTATMTETNEAVWLAASYQDDLLCTDDGWRFQRVTLRSRFYTSYEEGWAKRPHLLEK